MKRRQSLDSSFGLNAKNRYRKKPQQMEVLYKVFKEHKGKIPSRKLRLKLAAELGLKENQIYKWFWELTTKR